MRAMLDLQGWPQRLILFIYFWIKGLVPGEDGRGWRKMFTRRRSGGWTECFFLNREQPGLTTNRSAGH